MLESAPLMMTRAKGRCWFERKDRRHKRGGGRRRPRARRKSKDLTKLLIKCEEKKKGGGGSPECRRCQGSVEPAGRQRHE